MKLPNRSALAELLRLAVAPLGSLAAWGGGLVALSSPVRNAAFVLFICGILAYGAGFAWWLLSHFDMLDLIRELNGDDAFYYFKIAQYLADGKFSTFDGGITRTNGYHPVWLLLITPFYWLFDTVQAPFSIKAFEILLVAGGVALIALAARLAHLPWVLLIGVLPPLYMMGGSGLLHGMEAAAVLFWLGLLFLALTLWARKPARWFWLLAAVVFSLPWVRLELAAVSFAASGALYLLGFRDGGASQFARLKPLLASAAGLVVYFAWNQLAFGGAIPVSGASRQVWSEFRWQEEGGYSLVRNLQEVLQIHAFDDELPVALGICAGFLLLLCCSARFRSPDNWPLLIFLVGAFSVASGHLGKFVQTVLAIHPYWGSYLHYFVPGYLMTALAVPVGCYVALGILRSFPGPRRSRTVKWLARGIVAVGTIFLVVTTDFAAPFQDVRARAERSQISEQREIDYLGALTMNRLLPEGSVIGSWDAGIIGYFSGFPTVNLDGVVNSYEYFRAIMKKPGASRYYWRTYPELVRQFGITHFAQSLGTGLSPINSDFYRHFFESIIFESSHTHPISAGQWAFNIWRNFPPESPPAQIDAAAWLWQRLAPHADYQSDEVTAIVDGRLVQLFRRGCASGEASLALAFSWDAEGRGVSNTHYWSVDEQNSLGYCARTLVLPKGAEGSVSIEVLPAADFMGQVQRSGRRFARSVFDIHSWDGQLIYIKHPCTLADTQETFFLHVFPADANELAEGPRRHGFDNLDFRFGERGAILEGKCMASVLLPSYAIASISTGQFNSDGKLWIAEFAISR